MIRGTRVSLRPIMPGELETFIAQINNIETRGDYMTTRLFEPQKLRDDFARHGFISDAFTRLAMVDADDNLVGTLFHFTTRPYSTMREIGCRVFAEEARGLGYASEALRLLVDNLFDNYPVNRLEWCCDPRNTASARVAVKNGFRQEGVMRGIFFGRGEYHDSELYALLRDEWKVARRAA